MWLNADDRLVRPHDLKGSHCVVVKWYSAKRRFGAVITNDAAVSFVGS